MWSKLASNWAKGLLNQPAFATGAVLLGIALIAAPITLTLRSRGALPQPKNTERLSAAKPAAKSASAAATTATAGVASRKVATPGSGHRTQMIAFYANFDELGDPSLEANIDEIDVLMPMWYHLDSSGRVTVDDPARTQRVMSMIKARKPDLKVMPIVNNYDKASEKWNAPQVGKLLADPAKRRSMAAAIVSAMKRDGFDGVNIDFESFTAADKANIVAFMAELYPRAKAAGLEVSMDVIVAGSAYDHVALSRHVDYLIPMMYDEHWKTSPAGPISSHGWYERTLTDFYTKVPAEKVVIGLGTYAYDWGRSGARAASKTHAAASDLARKYRKPMYVHSSGLNSTFGYSEGGVNHQVWILDAMSIFNQMSTSYADSPRGYAIWRLGAEDPDVWKVVPYRDRLDETVAQSLVSDRRSVVYDKELRLITGGQTRP